MTMRWQERRVEDELLKKELLLRLLAEQSDAPGRSAPATGPFRRRAQYLMLRRPLFAFRYYRLAKQLDVERRQRVSLFARLVHARRISGAAIARLAAGLRWQRWRMHRWLVRVRGSCGSGLARLMEGCGGVWLVLHAGRIRCQGTCRSARESSLAELRRQRRFLGTTLARLVRIGESVLARLAVGLAAGGRRLGLESHGALVRVNRGFWAALAILLAGLRRQRLLLRASLIRLRRICGSAMAGLAAEGRHQQVLFQGGLVRGLRVLGSALVALAATSRRVRLVVFARLVRFEWACRSAGTRWAAEVRRRRDGLHERVLRVRQSCGSWFAGVAELSRRLARPAGVAFAGVVLIAAGVVATGKLGSRGKTGATLSAKPQSARRTAREPSHPPRVALTPLIAAHRHRPAPKRVSAKKPVRHAPRMTLVSNTVQTSTVQTSTEPTPPPVSGPSPLRAPPGAPPPTPLKAPK